MSSSGSNPTTPTMEGIGEAKIGGRSRMVLGGRPLQAEVLVSRGRKEAVSVANETVAAARGEETIDEVTVQKEDPLNDVALIKVDVMVDLRKGMTSKGMIRGRLPADLAHSSGPHWPRDEMGLTAARDLLLLRIR